MLNDYPQSPLTPVLAVVEGWFALGIQLANNAEQLVDHLSNGLELLYHPECFVSLVNRC